MPTAGMTNGNLAHPPQINLQLYPVWLEKNGYYSVESELRGMIYVAHGDETAIITASKGYVRFKTKDLLTIAEELKGLQDDETDRKRMGVEL